MAIPVLVLLRHPAKGVTRVGQVGGPAAAIVDGGFVSVAASEFARLVVALSVVPFLVFMTRNMRFAHKSRTAYVVLLAAIYSSYVLTIVEGFFAPDLLDALQHLSYGVAGVAGVIVAWRSRQAVLEEMNQ